LLYTAVTNNDRDQVRLLIQDRIRDHPNFRLNPPVHLLFDVQQGSLSMAELRVRHGANKAFQVALANDNPFLWSLDSSPPPLARHYCHPDHRVRIQIKDSYRIYRHVLRDHLFVSSSKQRMWRWNRIALELLQSGTSPDIVIGDVKSAANHLGGDPP